MKNKLFPGLIIFTFILLLMSFYLFSCSMSLPATGSSMVSTKEDTVTDSSAENKQPGRETIEETTSTLKLGEPSIVITNGRTNPECMKMALTFDSGWEYENTEQLLDILDEFSIKATFFTRGLWAKDHPEIALDIVSRGHDLENHSLTHGHMNEMSDEEIRNEISETTRIIKDITGFDADLFRPPYGEYNERVLTILNEEGYRYTVMWTVDSHDWAKELNGTVITKDYVVGRVLENASDGGIVLMHVGGHETVNALPEIINGLMAKGYLLVRVKEML